MNIIFFVIVIISLIFLIIGKPDSAFNIMVDGGKNGIMLALKLLPIYAVWLSVLKVVEKSNISKFFGKIFSPLLKWLFPKESKKTNEYLSINFTANFLGMGGAGTSAGIKAIDSMYKGSSSATNNMIMLLVINCTSIQFIPATIIALRGANGSANPSDIFLPCLINTIITTTIGIILVKLFSKK